MGKLAWPAWRREGVLAVVGVLAFHVGMLGGAWAAAMVLFLFCVMGVARGTSERGAFWLGLAMGMGCYPPPLFFFVQTFGAAAISLWLILSVWIGFFTWMAHTVRHRVPAWAMVAVLPILWMGFEYLRCEGNPLRFTWLSPGLAFPPGGMLHDLGVYGIGFLAALVAALAWAPRRWRFRTAVLVGGVGFMAWAALRPVTPARDEASKTVMVAGIQSEHPNSWEVPHLLDKLLAAYPAADLLVMSEYTLDTAPTDEVLAWCKAHGKYLVIGGTRDAEGPGDKYYDTAFVVGPEGKVLFEQGKSVPIQFMQDGLPAKSQALWDSPWGKLGLLVCYDLSYTRVADRLVGMGAQGLIVPTMDIEKWGGAEHALHARIGPLRACEYGVPVVRVCSSGISQIVDSQGHVQAGAAYPGQGAMLAGKLNLGPAGRLPIDRYVAPVCSVLTLAYTMVAITISTHRRIARRRKNRAAKPAAVAAATNASPPQEG